MSSICFIFASSFKITDMKKLILASIISIVLFTSCENNSTNISNKALLSNLEQLYLEEDFFKLKQVFDQRNIELSEYHKLYYSSIIKNVFNQPVVSNAAINQLIAQKHFGLNDTLMHRLLRTKLQNHINLYEYAEATQTSDYIQTHFRHLTDSSEREMLENEIKIWGALKDVPKQEIIKNKDVIIPMIKDKVGLFNVDVAFGNSIKNLLFDTGANFSVIVKSLVDELGLTYIEADFYVTAATGVRVKSGIAIADEISLEGVVFKNVFFLVLDDKDLSFPQIEYYPNGAIGFPVIEALEEMRINQKNQIFVPQTPVEYHYENFALNGLMPIVAGIYNGDTLRFNFDTGATNTSLYPLFYKTYKTEIEENYEKEVFQAGSGGGTVEFEGFVIDELTLKIADSETVLSNLRVHMNKFGATEHHVHGNFGQDYIKQFDEMIISFKYSSVLFN